MVESTEFCWTFLFLCSFCCPHFLGFCLSFPVLTHGSWGTVRHLLAFAPTNAPTDSKHLDSSTPYRPSQVDCTFPACGTVLSQNPRVPAFSTTVWMDTALKGICPGLAPWARPTLRAPAAVQKPELYWTYQPWRACPRAPRRLGHAGSPFLLLSLWGLGPGLPHSEASEGRS